jgi:hypothetical protein
MPEQKEYLRADFGNGDDASVSRFLLFGGGWEPNPLSAPEDSPVGDAEDSSLSTCDDSPRDDSLLTAKSDTSLGSSVSTSLRAVRTRDNNLPFFAAALPGLLFAMTDDPLGLGEREAKGDIAIGELNWASSGSVSLGGLEGELLEAMTVGTVGATVGAAGFFCKSECGLKKSDMADCLFGVLNGTVWHVSKDFTKLQVPYEPSCYN